MPKHKVSDYFLYKHRYLVGYILLGIVFAVVLVATQFVTNGISSAEMASTVASADFGADILSSNIVNIPFKALQWASVSLFGLSVFSIKLPAAILAALAGFAVPFLLKRWSKMSVVIPASILILASSQFLFSAQDGTPNILYILLPVLILLFGHIAGSSKELKLPALLATAAILAVSIYTPFLIYFVATIAVVCLAHPKIRLAIRTATRLRLWLSLLAFLLFITPLVLSCINQPDTIRLLLTDGYTNINVLSGLKQFISALFLSSATTDGTVLAPLYGLPSAALILVGLFHGLRQRHRTKYYVVMGWLIIAAILLTLDPEATALVFAPLALLLTKGLAIVIQKWYNIFPGNPYARVAGLAPIAFLVLTICVTSALHFLLGYHYSPQVAKNYNNDITLLRQNIKPGSVVLTSKNSLDYDFYKILENQEDVTVVAKLPDTRPASLITIGRQGAVESSNLKLIRIVTSSRTEDANRLYIYE